MQLFFIEQIDPNHFEFSEEESKHCVRVLRKKKGDTIQLLDGKGNEALAVIDDDNPKKCKGSILNIQHHPKNKSYHLHLAIAPTKNFERMEWMLEKAIEIGIDEISFIECANSERVKINMERCRKIAISAIKQSKQFHLPILHPIESFSSFLGRTEKTEAARYIAWCETEKTQSLSSAIAKPLLPHHIVLIGPEGDFSAKENEQAKAKGFCSVSLGNNILRSETAGLFAVAHFAALEQRFQGNINTLA